MTGTGLINGEEAGCDRGLSTCVGNEVKGVCASGEDPVTCLPRTPGMVGPDCALSRNLCGADIWEGADVGAVVEGTVEGGVMSCECDDRRFCDCGLSSVGGDKIDFRSITGCVLHSRQVCTFARLIAIRTVNSWKVLMVDKHSCNRG